MRRLLLAALLLLPLLSVLLPFTASAANTASISITVQGSDNASLPGPPLNFSTSASTSTVLLTWNLGGGATHTYIIRAIGYQPTSLSDGILIYTSTGTSCTDNISTGDMLDGVYYSAWSLNSNGFSTTYATANITGGVNMTNTILIGILALIGLTTLALAWWKQRWPIALISAIFWLACTGACFASSSSLTNYYDTYHLFGYASLLMVLACAYEPVYEMGQHFDETDDSGYSPSERHIMNREKRIYGRMDAIARLTSGSRRRKDDED